MDHILQKNSTDVVLGGFEPNQSYLVTALNLWTVGRIHTRSGFYSIKEVSTLVQPFSGVREGKGRKSLRHQFIYVV